MEEPKPDQDQPTQTQSPTPTPTPEPPSTATTPPPPPPPPQPPATPPKSKKRPLDTNVQIQDTKYYKMRVVLKDLHPHIFEVLRTPDFRNCKAAHEIQEQIKFLMELYKEMMAERVSVVKSKTVPESQLLSGDNGVVQKPQEQLPDVKPAEQPQPENPFQSGIAFEKQRPEEGEAQGTYIVGGSAFGWNFVTFTGSQPVYYGVTKESFRSAQMNAGET